jgi:hypothetical protein
VTTVRLAVVSSGRMLAALAAAPVVEGWTRPAVLVSYAYFDTFKSERGRYPFYDDRFRDYALDSGAFTAANAGHPVDLAAYIAFVRTLRQRDRKLSEVFALDVIGDWEASARNTELMWQAGIHCIPTFHVGEPTAALLAMAKTYPKIAVGGAVRWPTKQKIGWLEQVFAHVWPKRIHGLGMMGRQIVERFPFDSVDASDWEFSPTAFGNLRSLPGASGLRGFGYGPKNRGYNLRAEMEWYMALERDLAQRWGPTLAPLRQEAA